MSLDNVLAVAGTARHHIWVLVIGLTLSVALMGVAATLVANILRKVPWISYLGLILIAVVAVNMIWDGGHQVATAAAHAGLFDGFHPISAAGRSAAGAVGTPTPTGRAASGATGSCGSRPYVLVHVEDIVGIVFRLHPGEAFVVVAKGCLAAGVALVIHHEVRIGAGEVVRMHRLPVVRRPLLEAPASQDRDRCRR